MTTIIRNVDGIDLTVHALIDTHIDLEKGIYTIKVGSWPDTRLGEPRLVSEVPMHIPEWDISYSVLGEVFLETHPEWGGSDVPKPSDKHIWSPLEQQWFLPLLSLQEAKDKKWSEIKIARSVAEYGGFTWDGSTFDSDFVSQQRINGAVTLAQMNSSFTIDWTLADNSTRTLSASEMCMVGFALGLHVATQFGKAQQIRQLVDNASTIDEVAAITYD